MIALNVGENLKTFKGLDCKTFDVLILLEALEYGWFEPN